MNKTNNALELAFKKAVTDHTSKKKADINSALFDKQQSNKIKLPDKSNENKKITRNERVGKGNS